MHFTDNQIRYTLPLLLQLVHTQRKCKNRIQLLLYPAFLAESEGLGSLRSPSSLLRKLSYYRFLLTRLRLAKDCKGSNPFLLSSKKQDIAFAMSCLLAESEGLGSLRSPASLLRKLSYYRLLLTRLRLAKDCKGSNPLLSYQQKNKGYSKRYTLYSWRRVRDSNPRSR